jgi:hypothetical protein
MTHNEEAILALPLVGQGLVTAGSPISSYARDVREDMRMDDGYHYGPGGMCSDCGTVPGSPHYEVLAIVKWSTWSNQPLGHLKTYCGDHYARYLELASSR